MRQIKLFCTSALLSFKCGPFFYPARKYSVRVFSKRALLILRNHFSVFENNNNVHPEKYINR